MDLIRISFEFNSLVLDTYLGYAEIPARTFLVALVITVILVARSFRNK